MDDSCPNTTRLIKKSVACPETVFWEKEAPGESYNCLVPPELPQTSSFTRLYLLYFSSTPASLTVDNAGMTSDAPFTSDEASWEVAHATKDKEEKVEDKSEEKGDTPGGTADNPPKEIADDPPKENSLPRKALPRSQV